MIRKDFEGIALKLEENGFVEVHGRTSLMKEIQINKKRFYVEIGHTKNDNEVGIRFAEIESIKIVEILSTKINDIDCLTNSAISMYSYFNQILINQDVFKIFLIGFSFGENSIIINDSSDWSGKRRSAIFDGYFVSFSFSFFLEKEFDKSYITQKQSNSFSLISVKNRFVRELLEE